MTDVLMYSGGLDSYIIGATYEIENYIFVRLGNEDNERELELLTTMPWFQKMVTVVELPISRFELPNKILPFRNHMLAMIGAQYGSHIYFGFTGGDTTKDKDYVFKSQIEGMLNYFALDQHKVNHQHYPYTIEMPYKDSSKGEMVRDFISAGNDPWELITKSRSCYSAGDKECGQCRSCQRKFVALAVNGYDYGAAFETHPRLDGDGLAHFLTESQVKGRFQKEVDEITAAIRGETMYG